MRFFAALIASLFTTLPWTFPTASHAAGWQENVQATVQTNGGRLEIVAVGMGAQLRLNGRLLQDLDESGASVAQQWPETSPKFLLLDLPTGGGSCPDLYRLLDVSVPDKPHLTKAFGTCQATPMLRPDGERILVDFPATPERRAGTWTYDPSTRRLDDPFNGAVTRPLF
jgi:hypothetical protein